MYEPMTVGLALGRPIRPLACSLAAEDAWYAAFGEPPRWIASAMLALALAAAIVGQWRTERRTLDALRHAPQG